MKKIKEIQCQWEQLPTRNKNYNAYGIIKVEIRSCFGFKSLYDNIKSNIKGAKYGRKSGGFILHKEGEPSR